MNKLQSLSDQLNTVLEQEGRVWLNHARQQLKKLDDDLELVANQLAIFSASAKRKTGLSVLSGEIASGFSQDAYGQCDKVYLQHWSSADAVRVLLLVETIASRMFSADELFQLCYRYSDGGERASLLKGLALMDLTVNSTDYIIDVARTNSLALYSALIYKNPWPVVNFPLPAFNQVVLKSLFMGINIINVEGLRGTRNPELGRMAADYAQERLDAGREIPESLWLAVDVSMMSEAGLTAWESALASDPQQSRCQLALLGCHWQSAALPENLQRAAEVHSSFYN